MASRQSRWVGLTLGVVAVGIVLFFIFSREIEQSPEAAGRDFPVSRHVHWEFTVRNLTDQALHEVEFLSFLPLPDTWQQSLVAVTGSHPIEKQLNSQAQSIGRIELTTIPPYGQRNIRLEAELAMAEDFDNPELASIESLLEAEALVESDHGQIVQLAQELDRGDSEKTIRAIYEWLIGEVTYSGYDPVDRGALHGLTQRNGDCTEYSALAVALARAIGLPARMVNGYVMPEDGRLGAYDFHAWAEIRVDDRWLIIDAQDRHFDPPPAHYLATHYGTSQSRPLGWTRFHSPEARVAIEMR